MVLTRATAASLEFSKTTRLRAPVLTAVLFAVIAALPLLAPGAIDGARLVAAIACGGLAAVFFAYARRRTSSVTIDLDARMVRSRFGTTPLDGARALSLVASDDTDEAPRRRYRVQLELPAGPGIVLLEGGDPGRVLTDLRKVLELLPLPVVSGWSLPREAAPWRASPASGPTAELRELSIEPDAAQRRGAVAVAFATAVTSVAMGLMHWSRLRRGDATSMLSASLTALTVTILVLIAIAVARYRLRLRRSGDDWWVEHRTLGMTWKRRALPGRQVTGAWAVAPGDAPPDHVVVTTEAGVFSLPCTPEEAPRVARALHPVAAQGAAAPLDDGPRQSSTRSVPGAQRRV